MLRQTTLKSFRMSMGEMFVDFKLVSRDHSRVVRVEDAKVDKRLPTTVAPLSWLEGLRSRTARLPTGFYREEPVHVSSTLHVTPVASSVTTQYFRPGSSSSSSSSSSPSSSGKASPAPLSGTANGMVAGPLVMYVDGQTTPVVLDVAFVPDELLRRGGGEIDLRLGMDAIAQCTLFAELRPGGLLADQPLAALRPHGLKVPLAASPLVARPWTRMKHMFIDELQRGPQMTEFVGYNSRNGSPWRFSQHCRYFRVGLWRETIRRGEMHEGIHIHSSQQKSHQQAVPEVRFLAPGP